MKVFTDIDLKLCHSCGICVSICPTKSIFIINGLPKLIKECKRCGMCFSSCPGIEFRYPDFNRWIFGSTEVDNEIGHYHSIFVGHATEEVVRKGGSSGGVVTALLLGLLRRREITGAIITTMDKEKPWLARVKIATCEEEIIAASQSKYTIVSVNEILACLNAQEGNFALVGLPCHIHGIRKLEKTGWENIKKIKYLIGIFCGFNMRREATDFLIRKLKVKYEDIESLEYRGGDWPGGFLLKTKDGRKYFIEKHIYNYLNLMFVPKRCLICPDFTNEFADLSVGDAWDKSLGSLGWSTIIVRTKRGAELMNSGINAKDIIVNASDKEKLKESHAQLFLYKKKGILIRQRLMSIQPDFDLSTPSINTNETVFNTLFYYLIFFMSTDFAIRFFRYLPVALPGLLGKYARSTINFISQPQKTKVSEKKKVSLFEKISREYKYLFMNEWDFSDVGDHWDSIDDYDDINKETYSYFRRFIDGYRLSKLPKQSYVLDICSRTGNGTLFFWRKGIIRKVVCADFSKRMQSICAQRLLESGMNFEKKLIESIPLPFQDREFDVVLCFETVEHVCKPDIFIKELGRVVKGGGQIVLSTPNPLWRPIHSLAAIFNLHHSEGPCRFISRARLYKYLNKAGLDIITERTTILVPAGPKPLLKLGEYLEEKIGRRWMNIFGLRKVLICRKKY